MCEQHPSDGRWQGETPESLSYKYLVLEPLTFQMRGLEESDFL